MHCTHKLSKAHEEDFCRECGEDIRGGSDRRIVRPWVGKLHHARTLCDDWGTIRDESGRLILTVTVPPSADIKGWEQYRSDGTDPTQPIVDVILAALNGPNVPDEIPTGRGGHG